MSSPISDKTAQLKQLQKVCSKLIGDLKSRKVSSEKANQYLDEVSEQIGQMRDWMIENYQVAKKTTSKDQNPEIEMLNQQLGTMEHKIKRLGKILSHTQTAIADDQLLDQLIESEVKKKVMTKDPVFQQSNFIREMHLRGNKLLRTLTQIESIQAKMEKFDAAKKAKELSTHPSLKKTESKNLFDPHALKNQLSQLARVDESLRKPLDAIARKALKPGDPFLGNSRFCEDYRIGKYLLESGCVNEANLWFDQCIEDFKWSTLLKGSHTKITLLTELALLNHKQSISLLLRDFRKKPLKYELINVMPTLLRSSTNTKILSAILQYQKGSSSLNFKDSLYTVINRPELSEKTIWNFISEHVTQLAYISGYYSYADPLAEATLKIDRGEKRFEDWLVNFISPPGMGKKFLLALNGTMPPAIGPLCTILDPIVLSEIRTIHPKNKALNAQQKSEIRACDNYCSLRARDPNYKESLLGTECILRMMQLEPKVIVNQAFIELLDRPDIEPEDHIDVVNSYRGLFERGKEIPGLRLDSTQRFLEFLVNCTEEDMLSLSLDREVELFSSRTTLPEYFQDHIKNLLPLLLVPPELRGHLFDQAPPPNQVLHSMIQINKARLGSIALKDAVAKRLNHFLRNTLRTPLNLAIANFALSNADLLGLDQESSMMQNAHRIISGKGFAASKTA